LRAFLAISTLPFIDVHEHMSYRKFEGLGYLVAIVLGQLFPEVLPAQGPDVIDQQHVRKNVSIPDDILPAVAG
jgi:hypothetical protein